MHSQTRFAIVSDMDIRDYLKKHDLSQDDFAKSIGVTQGLVWQWLEGRQRITAERALEIEEKTKGEITREELRPDLFRKSAGDTRRGGRKVA